VRLKHIAPPIVRRSYHQLRGQAAWLKNQLRVREIDLRRALMGGEGTYEAGVWAELTGEPQRASMLLSDSPHFALLKSYEEHGEAIFGKGRFEKTAYFRNAAQCVQFLGHYFGARSQAGILAQARAFVSLYEGAKRNSRLLVEFPSALHHSAKGSLPIVRPTLTSGTVQITDGHHRLAVVLMLGQMRTKAVILPPAPTELQALVLRTAQTQCRRELYQPIDTVEFDSSWGLVRRCRDRLQLMLDVLDGIPLKLEEASALDLGCSYGWFVKEFALRGSRVLGVDPDPSVLKIGRIAYGLGSQQQQHSNLQEFLTSNGKQFDIVILLSVLHHLAMKPDFGRPEDILRQVDALTGSCLFLDAGQNHEEWFRQALPEWNPEYIADLVKKNTTFRKIVPLGVDSDNVGEYSANYGRTLFACLR
jgi:2-polyprenyl-3-methyl-5-hydroxy-6-metoxy-1,4-benzoquinol methylase